MIKAHLIKAAIKVAYSNAHYSLYEIPKGILKCQKKLNNKDTHYVVICDHIGDFLITMGYMKAYREKNHIKHITICTTQKMLSLLKCYIHFYDEYMTLDSEELYEILKVGSTRFGCRVLRKMPNITLVNPGNAFVLEYFEYIDFQMYRFMTALNMEAFVWIKSVNLFLQNWGYILGKRLKNQFCYVRMHGF